MENKRTTKNWPHACPWLIKNFVDKEAEFVAEGTLMCSGKQVQTHT
jgi:hypothetical protein